LEPIPTDILAMISAIEDRHTHLRPAIAFLKRGVAFHNATVPHEVRQLIERAARNRQLRVVAATTTLAEGVDLPFRATIVERWLMGFGANQRPMSALTFRNIAGRCGRAGTYTEGDTILFDNPLGTLRFAHPRMRPSQQLSLLMPPAELESAVRTTDGETCAAIVGAQLLAAIGENEQVDDIIERFQQSSYAAHTGDDAQFGSAVAATLNDIASDPPLAIAASPFHLTFLGIAVNQTGLSPRTARELLGVLAHFNGQEGMEVVGAELLRKCAGVPEQNSDPLRKTVLQSKSRVPVKPPDFEQVIRARASGLPLMTSFGQLDAVRRSKKQVRFELWAAGEVPSPTWDQDFDKYVEFINASIDSFLPWLFRASAILSAAVRLPAQSLNWTAWSQALLERVTPESRMDDFEPTDE
jgi:helicase